MTRLVSKNVIDNYHVLAKQLTNDNGYVHGFCFSFQSSLLRQRLQASEKEKKVMNNRERVLGERRKII